MAIEPLCEIAQTLILPLQCVDAAPGLGLREVVWGCSDGLEVLQSLLYQSGGLKPALGKASGSMLLTDGLKSD